MEAAPLPKRRRATIVEGTTAKPSPLTIAKKSGSQSPNSVSPVIATTTVPNGPAGSTTNVRKVLPKAPAPVPAPAVPQTPATASTAAVSKTPLATTQPVPKRATRASLGSAAVQAK